MMVDLLAQLWSPAGVAFALAGLALGVTNARTRVGRKKP